MGNWVIDLLNYFKTIFKKNKNIRKVYKNKSYKKSAKQSIDQQKIDVILDKISKSGYDSLTKQEKDILFKAGEN